MLCKDGGKAISSGFRIILSTVNGAGIGAWLFPLDAEAADSKKEEADVKDEEIELKDEEAELKDEEAELKDEDTDPIDEGLNSLNEGAEDYPQVANTKNEAEDDIWAKDMDIDRNKEPSPPYLLQALYFNRPKSNKL